MGGHCGLREAEVLVVVENLLVDGLGPPGDGRSGDVLDLDVVETKEAPVDFIGCCGGHFGAIGCDELDADLVEVERRVAVVLDDDTDGQEAVSGVVQAEKFPFGACLKRVGGDDDVLFFVCIACRIGRCGERGRRLLGGVRCWRQKGGEGDGREDEWAETMHRCETETLMRRERRLMPLSVRAVEGVKWRRMLILLYSLALGTAAVLSAPIWGLRMARQGRYRAGLRERLGGVPERLVRWVAGRPVVWVHAVSVGETMAATRLVAELEEALPGYAVVVSTTTPTGQRVARERFGVDRVFFYPLDFAFAVRPYVRALKPALVVLMESELWPRMLVECERAGVPVAVVNARVSDRSLPRYMRLRMLWRPLLRKVRLLLAQSEEDARRWRLIGAGAECVVSAGNLKYDVRTAAETPLTVLVRKHLPAEARVLVCGSTHDGEETLLLDCLKFLAGGNGVTLLAPRHPERAGLVLEMAAARGLVAQRLSVWRIGAVAIPTGSVLIVDTVGELAALYSLASVAFVGGTLVPHGGQNPLEPARAGVPVVMGPSFFNFREMMAKMQAARAVEIVDKHTLCGVIARHIASGDIDGAGERARTFAASITGATARTVAALVALVQERAG